MTEMAYTAAKVRDTGALAALDSELERLGVQIDRAAKLLQPLRRQTPQQEDALAEAAPTQLWESIFRAGRLAAMLTEILDEVDL